MRIQGTKGQNGQLSFIGLLSYIWRVSGLLGALPNATLRYKTVPGTHGWPVFHSKRTNRSQRRAQRGAQSLESGKLQMQSFESFRVQVHRSVGLSSYGLCNVQIKLARDSPPVTVSCDSYLRNLVAATWLKAAVRRNVQAGGFSHRRWQWA